MRIGLLYIVTAAVLVFAPIAYVGRRLVRSMDREYWTDVNERSRQSLESRKNEFMEKVGKPAGVLAQTSRFPWMKDFLEAYEEKSSELEEIAETAAENLVAIYPDLGGPMRIAILDTTGKEILAVARQGPRTSRVTQDELVDRSDGSWIADVVAGTVAGAYATEIYRLPAVDGPGRVPHVTVAQALRVETRIVAIAWVEVNLKSLFDGMSKPGGGAKSYLVDAQQRYLIHTDQPSKGFAFESGRTATLSDDFGDTAEKMRGRFSLAWPQDRPERVLIGDEIPYVGPAGPTVGLILSTSVLEATSEMAAQKKRFATVLVVSFILFVAAAMVLSRRFVGNPMSEACRSVRMLREGKRLEEMPGSVLSATRGLSAELRLLSDELVTRAITDKKQEGTD